MDYGRVSLLPNYGTSKQCRSVCSGQVGAHVCPLIELGFGHCLLLPLLIRISSNWLALTV